MGHPLPSKEQRGKNVGVGDASVFNEKLARAEMPPEIGIGNGTRGDGKDDEQKNENHQVARGEIGARLCHLKRLVAKGRSISDCAILWFHIFDNQLLALRNGEQSLPRIICRFARIVEPFAAHPRRVVAIDRA